MHAFFEHDPNLAAPANIEHLKFFFRERCRVRMARRWGRRACFLCPAPPQITLPLPHPRLTVSALLLKRPGLAEFGEFTQLYSELHARPELVEPMHAFAEYTAGGYRMKPEDLQRFLIEVSPPPWPRPHSTPLIAAGCRCNAKTPLWSPWATVLTLSRNLSSARPWVLAKRL